MSSRPMEDIFRSRSYLIDHLIEEMQDEDEPGMVYDHSGYHYVDGEEGDYGIVCVYRQGLHLYDWINHGGDQEEYIFSEFGKVYYRARIAAILTKYMDSVFGEKGSS